MTNVLMSDIFVFFFLLIKFCPRPDPVLKPAAKLPTPASRPTNTATNAPITLAAAPPSAKDPSTSATAEMAVAAAAHQVQHQQQHPATVSLAGTTDSLTATIEEKKVMKRAANRRSAQLSRKRKKQFIEELREENAILRRKELILRSIPDLVVVFDSAGRLLFVSESVGRLLSFKSDELDGSSFWERLCDESVKLLKAAFMDALAARNSDVASVASSTSSKSRSKKGKAKGTMDDDMDLDPDSVPLGSGMWELRLVDKDGSHHLVTLTGVVHFPSDESGHSTPECVCSIRPRENAQNVRSSFSGAAQPDRKRARNGPSNVVDPSSSSSTTSSDEGNDNDGASNAPSTTSEGCGSSTTESDSHFPPNLVRDAIKPQQSVISNASCGSTSALSSDGDCTSKSVSGTKRPANDNDECIISDGSSVRVSG